MMLEWWLRAVMWRTARRLMVMRASWARMLSEACGGSCAGGEGGDEMVPSCLIFVGIEV